MASKGSSRWGSLLSGAVSGLESRLDTILGEDADASARSRAAEKAAQEAKAEETRAASATLAPPSTASTDTSRNSSRTRVNDRLNERLAKALANQRSDAPSRTASPLIGGASPRTSLGSRPSVDIASSEREKPELVQPEPAPELGNNIPADAEVEKVAESSTLLTSSLPINPARVSEDVDSRPSIDLGDDTPAETSVEADEPVVPQKTSEELEEEMKQMREDHAEAERQRQEDMHANLERIDALQAKLTYLAKETLAAAKEANSSAKSGSPEQKLAEKDERIALLMEEGEKLSKTEMRHLTTIKKLRAKASEEEKSGVEAKKKLAIVEQSEATLKQQLKRTEQLQKQHTERLKRIPELEKSLDASKNELESSKSTVANLRKQLAESEKRAEEAESKARESAVKADSHKVSELQDQIEDAKLEKKLAEDRASAEIRRLGEEADRQKARATSQETELKGEISVRLITPTNNDHHLLIRYRVWKAGLRPCDPELRRLRLTSVAILKPNCSGKSRLFKHNTLLPQRTGDRSRVPSTVALQLSRKSAMKPVNAKQTCARKLATSTTNPSAPKKTSTKLPSNPRISYRSYRRNPASSRNSKHASTPPTKPSQKQPPNPSAKNASGKANWHKSSKTKSPV